MISIQKCPICDCELLQVIKKYEFLFPEKEEYDESIGTTAYKYERLLIFFEKIRKSRKPVAFYIALCESCGMIFTNPRFTNEEIEIKYKSIDKLESEKIRHQKLPALKTSERSKRINLLISGLRKNKPNCQKILDYGGAEGYNLISFVGPSNACYVLDYLKYEHPKDVTYLGRDVNDLRFDEFFDVILLCHILEHATEPKRLIEELLPHLIEGGLLYIEVPLGCYEKWKWLSEPLTHVNFFSEESLFNCLHRLGLDVIHISTKHQWVTHGEMWCINVVARKREGRTITKFKTTRQQMKNSYNSLKRLIKYCFSRFKDYMLHPRGILGLVKRKCAKFFK